MGLHGDAGMCSLAWGVIKNSTFNIWNALIYRAPYLQGTLRLSTGNPEVERHEIKGEVL